MSEHAPYRGRFAPSPTGPLHLGSLATAVGSYLDARIHQGQWLVRIEDIDPQRCKPEWTQRILHSLAVHGLVSDEPPVLQTTRTPAYQRALNALSHAGLTYPCACTRQDIEAANASRGFGENRIYPGTCAQGMPKGKTARSIRFRCPKATIEWQDHRLGQFIDLLSQTSGDFVLLRGDGAWAYHLAVVVDDAASEVTHIVRGDDLADTTARQLALFDALQKPRPAYWHLPVILAVDGQKLSKQTGAKALDDNTPVDNLNAVWKHFGFDALRAKTPAQWRELAAENWAVYRAKTAHQTNY
ncbi:tRNA glutamyl-Q(34) synthetase GluQRS [Limnobacter litoralis]|uniref:Glutamyl-Q tRNA(Asp) synthetase n=1 Tax=Limnobacter litoralis TaxID=481366 RepID=A0ABQ5YKU7_9BURK|nr:tRNA glutamyl-Q(34) synthetase GluQRS [Limnobacter litoralis]GLR25178.1 glutamyl-Q tRNA(Asp) synthetase [Limnobacter litoralis]